MRFQDLPGFELVTESGPNDRIFDGLLLLGPVVILLAAIAGRNFVTIGLAVSYLVGLFGYVLYRAAV